MYLNVKLSTVGLDLSGVSSVLTTLSSDRAELATTGPRGTTLRVRYKQIEYEQKIGKQKTLYEMASALRIDDVLGVVLDPAYYDRRCTLGIIKMLVCSERDK